MAAVANASSIVEGEVVEVLPGFGLAHVRAADGRVLGVTRQTPGVIFDQLRPGQQLRCRVTEQFHRVLCADVLTWPVALDETFLPGSRRRSDKF